MGQDIDDEIALINENQTRKRYIDPVLEKIGWYKKYIKEEVNSVKSDFISYGTNSGVAAHHSSFRLIWGSQLLQWFNFSFLH